MNGQVIRLEIVKHIVKQCRISQIVETGSHRGATSEWLAEFGLPLITIESNPRFAEFARRRLKSRRNTRVEEGDSVNVLARLVEDAELCKAPTLFYLDAHWGDYLPLGDELKVIMRHFLLPVVIIDDFAVPWDNDYGFDSYGPDKSLDIDYLSSLNVDIQFIFFPRVPARSETGARRGCAILTGNRALADAIRLTNLVAGWNHELTSND